MRVFQYGSNMSSARLNHSERLNGEAKVIAVATTVEKFDLGFTVWSKTNQCAAADLVLSDAGREVYGVLYEVPDYLMSRESAKEEGKRSLDSIEGEGVNYTRTSIEVLVGGRVETAVTYIVLNRKEGLVTSREYAQHIMDGLDEHGFPADYRQYVVSRIEHNNPQLREVFCA